MNVRVFTNPTLLYIVREVRRKIVERNIFTLSIEEIEEGERPGWVKRAAIVVDGEKVTMTFEVEWRINKLKAKWELLKLRAKIFHYKYVA